MKKELVATISSSMRFYTEEARRLNIFKWDAFSKIYEPQYDLIHCAPMTPEQEKEEHDRLLEEHKAKMRKSDYLIVINKDCYIGEGVKEEIAYADEIGLGVLYSEYQPGYEYLGAICHNGNTYYLRAPELHYMEDGITEHPDFILSDNIKKIRLAAVPGIPNANHVQYEQDEIIKCMKSEYMQELFSTGLMKVEWGNSASKCDEGPIRLCVIDPSMIVGKVITLGRKYLFIKPNGLFTEVFKDDSDLLAYMRYSGTVKRRDDESGITDVSKIRITTWDIWHNELSEEYLKTIS